MFRSVPHQFQRPFLRDDLGQERRGTAYLLAVGTTMIVALLAWSASHTLRLQLRSARSSGDELEASLLAASGIEHAMSALKNDDDWRMTYTHGVFWPVAPGAPLGSGHWQWKLLDADGNLADDPQDTVTIVSVGRVHNAVRSQSLKFIPTDNILPVLRSSVHAAGNLLVKTSTTAFGGPVTSNGTLTVGSGVVLNGSVKAMSISNGGTIQGTQTVLTSPLSMPDSTAILAYYNAVATTIDYISIPGGVIEDVILSHSNNPYGTPNAQGIYRIDIPSKYSLLIQDCRIHGTLLVTVPDKGLLRIKRGVIWEPAGDFASLIASCSGLGTSDVRIEGAGVLEEAAVPLNFNPPTLPYNGVSNAVATDFLPPKLKGVFHVMRLPGDTTPTTIASSVTRQAVFIADGNVEIDGGAYTHDDHVLTNAPEGYSAGSALTPIPETSRPEAAP